MRALKFRAWNPYTKTMLQPATPFELATGIITWPSQAYDHVMQYTGLKDKNGVEIYEGDIVVLHDVDHREWGASDIAVIEYNNYWTGFGCGDGGAWYRISDFGSVEKLGNIYENPELLEK